MRYFYGSIRKDWLLFFCHPVGSVSEYNPIKEFRMTLYCNNRCPVSLLKNKIDQCVTEGSFKYISITDTRCVISFKPGQSGDINFSIPTGNPLKDEQSSLDIMIHYDHQTPVELASLKECRSLTVLPGKAGHAAFGPSVPEAEYSVLV